MQLIVIVGTVFAAFVGSVVGSVGTQDAAILFEEIAGNAVYAFETTNTLNVVAADAGFVYYATYDTSTLDGQFAAAPYPKVSFATIPANISGVNRPHGIWASADGTTFLVADTLNFVVRQYDSSPNTLNVIAGQVGQEGHSGDGGPATSATLYSPYAGLSNTALGGTFFVDLHGCTVRQIDTSGNIQTIFGTHRVCSSSTNDYTHLDHPTGIATDGSNLYISQKNANSVVKIKPGVSTVQGIIYGSTGVAGITPDNYYTGGSTKITRPVCFLMSPNHYNMFCEENRVRTVGNTGMIESLPVTFGHPRSVSVTTNYVVVADSLWNQVVAFKNTAAY